MEERFIYSGTKKLRCGYTTGSCATAASKAAAQAILTGQPLTRTIINTPKGEVLHIKINKSEIKDKFALCSVIKDSGDDPDITNGIEIFAEVTLIDKDITIVGGKGIGKVTKPGLDQPVGEFAINSVPRKMITEALKEVAELFDYQGGFKVIISAPKGEEIALKTFNPRIGIIGGISIIGTTGIVEPMSNSAIIETIRTEANTKRAEGMKTLLLTVGNYSEKFIRENRPQLIDQCVMCSNFIGDAIDIGVSLGFKKIMIFGHIGKMVKLGSGIMNTHSSYADGRIETLITCGAIASIPNDILVSLNECVTTDAALDILFKEKVEKPLLDVLINRIHYYLQARAKNYAEIGALVFSYNHDIVLKTLFADDILNNLED